MLKQKLQKVILGLTLAAFSAVPMLASTSTDYDHNTNFRAYRTFSFYKVQTSNPLNVQRIEDRVTADLTKAGLERVESGGDLAITAIGDVHDKQEYNTFYDGLGGGGWGWGGWGGWGGGGWGGSGMQQTNVQEIPVGTLVLDMYDKKTHQLVWRGRSQSDLSNNSEKNTKTLHKDIDHMLNGFPPRAGS